MKLKLRREPEKKQNVNPGTNGNVWYPPKMKPKWDWKLEVLIRNKTTIKEHIINLVFFDI
jgi:hypothetical protein